MWRRVCVSEAHTLRAAFNDAFWNPQEGTFALALDGRKRQVASVTSNPGHCLYCGIVDPEKADCRGRAPDGTRHVLRLGRAHALERCPAYNPMSYHNGSVWPHDNAIIAAGLKRYGHDDGVLPDRGLPVRCRRRRARLAPARALLRL